MPYYSPTTAAILRRKSPPTCTLSLAHVSAAPKFHSQPSHSAKSSVKVRNAELNLSTMQVELQVDFSSVISVPVQVRVGDSAHVASSAFTPTLRRSKSRKRIHLKRNEINVIPFPSSTTSSLGSSSVSDISSPSTPTTASTPHILLRTSNPDVQLHSSSTAGATRRPRKGTVNTVSISTSVRSTVRASPQRNASSRQARNLSQLPPRPSSPTPKPLNQIPLAKVQQLKSEEAFEPPPYTSPPPPYSAAVDAAAEPSSKIVRPLPIPASNASKTSKIPIVSPTPITPQSSLRRPRPTSSELKTLLFLYRTIMYGIERRHRLESLKKQRQQHLRKSSSSSSPFISPGTSPTRTSEIHFGRFPLVEEDEDVSSEDDDDHPIFGGPRPHARPTAPRMQRKPSSKTPAERAAKDYDVQDALLAIRLRVFLKSQGVSEDELAVQFNEDDEESEDDVILVGHARGFPFQAARADGPTPVAVSKPIIAAPAPLAPTKSEAGKDRPIRSSPPPLSPVPKSTQPVPSMAYMIALIKMRNQQSPGQKLFSVVNDGYLTSGVPKAGVASRGRKSGLRSCAWVAGRVDGEDEKVVVEEVEEEFDSDSVVDWYAGLSY